MKIFPSEDELFAWLIDEGFDIVGCDCNVVVVCIDIYEAQIEYDRLDDGRIALTDWW